METQEHKALRETVRRFVDTEINPYVAEWEAEGIFPGRALFRKLGDLGLLGISKPEAWGGQGLDYSFEVAFGEELGAAHAAGLPMAIGVQTNMATPALARYGSDALRDEFLAPAIAGDRIASIAVSEPQAGSDVAAIRTVARGDGDDYVIDGQKMWITNATQADFFCVLVNTGGEGRHGNKSLIIVPADMPGVSVGARLAKIGMRVSDTASADMRISTGCGRSTRRNTMPVFGGAGRSVSSTRCPLCSPTPMARVWERRVRCRSTPRL